MADLTYRYVALTDTGLRRTNNQDSAFASSRLLALADGMGGAAAGDLASSTTIHVLRRLDGELEDDPTEALAGVVQRANDRLGELIIEDPAVEGMGTTLEALLWDGKKFAMAHIGDSRNYLLRDGELSQISDDHTFVQSLVDEGRLTVAEARVHPHRSLILRALLGRDDNDPDLSMVEPKAGDRFLMCSDGLSDMLDHDTIAENLAADSIDLAATELVRLALEAGGYDNVTVVIAEMVPADEPVPESLSCSNGQPQLVGAAANQQRPRTGHATSDDGGGAGKPPIDPDPEELRYAPRPPSRWRWVRRLIGLIVVLVVLIGIGKLTYDWTQKQYYVASDGGNVAIYRGVQAQIPGVTLNQVESTTTISISDLPKYRQKQVRDGIEASSRKDAEGIVANLKTLVEEPKEPKSTPQPSDKPSEKPSRKPTTKSSTTKTLPQLVVTS